MASVAYLLYVLHFIQKENGGLKLMDFEQIGLRVKNSRRKKHLTQEKFAEIIDVSPHYIYEIERGSKSMSIYTLDSVATNLDVSTDYLLYGSVSYHTDGSRKDPDELTVLVDAIPPQKRKSVARIIESILPYIK